MNIILKKRQINIKRTLIYNIRRKTFLMDITRKENLKNQIGLIENKRKRIPHSERIQNTENGYQLVKYKPICLETIFRDTKQPFLMVLLQTLQILTMSSLNGKNYGVFIQLMTDDEKLLYKGETQRKLFFSQLAVKKQTVQWEY